MKGTSREYDPHAYRVRRTRPDWVALARARYEDGAPLSAIAAELHVSTASLGVYRLNEAWDAERHREARHAIRPLWEPAVRAAYHAGVPFDDLCAASGLSETRIRELAKVWAWSAEQRWEAIWAARRGGLSRPDRARHRSKAHKFARRAMKVAPLPCEVARVRAEAMICPYCGRPITPDTAHIDHIEPLALGGDNAPDNLTACCGRCNRSKGSARLILWLVRKAHR